MITGGGSGMGQAMARRFGAAGCNVVVADIEEPSLDATVAELEAAGVAALGVRTDVAESESMDALGEAVTERFGDPHVVCLNAGVGAGGPMAELRVADWEWVLGVNLWGVIHGLRVFLPGLEARDEGHVVVTASVAGILSYPQMAPYNASKHAAVTIAETLHHELVDKGSKVGVTALCPGLVRTRILESDRNRPEKYRLPALESNERRESEYGELVREIYEGALGPDAVADMVHDAVVDGTFYVLTDHAFDDAIRLRHSQIEGRTTPQLEGHLIETHVRDKMRDQPGSPGPAR